MISPLSERSVVGGHADRVKILVEQRVNLMERNKLDRTVFHIAATFKDTAVLKVTSKQQFSSLTVPAECKQFRETIEVPSDTR